MNENYFGGGLDDNCFIIKLIIMNDWGIYCCIVLNVVGFEL